MSKVNDGGPAFPFDEKAADGGHWHSHAGMSKREWFAGQFLSGVSSDDSPLFGVSRDADQSEIDAVLNAHWSKVARAAYIAADAFIAAASTLSEGE